MVKISNEEYNNLNNKIRSLKANLEGKEKEILRLNNIVKSFNVLIVAISEPKQRDDTTDMQTIIVSRFDIKAKTKELIKEGFKDFKFFKVLGSIEAEPVKEITHYKIK